MGWGASITPYHPCPSVSYNMPLIGALLVAVRNEFIDFRLRDAPDASLRALGDVHGLQRGRAFPRRLDHPSHGFHVDGQGGCHGGEGMVLLGWFAFRCVSHVWGGDGIRVS